jgi:hypothetical protein
MGVNGFPSFNKFQHLAAIFSNFDACFMWLPLS